MGSSTLYGISATPFREISLGPASSTIDAPSESVPLGLRAPDSGRTRETVDSRPSSPEGGRLGGPKCVGASRKRSSRTQFLEVSS